MLDRTSDFINLSRWGAAFIVVASHLRQLVMCDYAEVAAPSLVIKAFYFLTQLGHEAVMIFFVISGYLIGGTAILRYKQRGFSLMSYTSHRTARIYTAYLPALIVFGLLDIFGAKHFASTALYTTNLGIASMSHPVVERLALSDFAGNLLMLQYGVVSAFGANAPLWSLAYEWWYYVLFGCAMLAISRPWLGGACLVVIAYALPASVLTYGLIWLLGAAVNIYAARGFPKPPRWIAYAMLCIVIVGARVTHMDGYDLRFARWRFVIDFVVALAFALVLLSYHRPGKRLLVPAFHHGMANFSYSLYLIHFPLMVFAVAALKYWLGINFLAQPSIASSAYYMGALASIIIVAWSFANLTEANTSSIQQWLAHRLQQFQRA